MSDYFNNIFDLIPEKTPENNRIGKPLKKKKKQKAGGVTGMSNDEFLSPENVAKDVFELLPSESTRVEGPLLSTAQEKAMSAQRWDNKTQEEKRIIKTQALAKNTVKDAPITLKDSKRVGKEWEDRGKPYTWSLQQKIDKVEADEAEIAEYGRKAQLNFEDSFRESYGMEKNFTNTILQGGIGGLTIPFAAGLEAIKGITGSDGGADWSRVMPDFYGVSKNPNFKGQSISLSDAVNKDWADKNRNLATLIDVVAPAGVGYKARKAYNLVDKTLDFANLELTKELLKKSPLKNAYLLNPMAEKLNDASSSYRITGKLGLDDAMQSGVVRPPKLTADELFEQSRFPGVHQYDPDNLSFNRGFADKRYLQNPDDVVFKTSKYPTAKSGEINPVTGKEVRSFGHTNTTHLFDPKTGEKISEVPLQNVDIYGATPHWLKGYQKIPKTSESKKLKSKIDFPKNITPPVVPSQPIAPWQMQDLPGLHLKSTMSQGPISKIIDKKGNINVNQALAIINKESGGKEKVNLIKKALGDDIPKKMDYNDFRKTTQEQLIPLERKLVNHSSDYGLNRIGHLANTDDQLNSAISFADSEIKNLNNEIIKRSKGLEKNTGKELATQKKDIAELKETLRNFTLGREAVLKQKNNPFENQTLILSNKSKFGRGSEAHGNPKETLGHVHFFTGGKNTGTLNVTQIQSDAFQGPHRVMPNNSKIKQWENILTPEGRKELVETGGEEAADLVQEGAREFLEDAVKEAKEALGPNPTQKQLLDKNHEERFLQEIVDYAAKRGDVNKIRLPTSETAAKIQGYIRTEKSKLNYAIEDDIFLLKHNKKQNIPDEINMNTGVEIRYTDKVRAEKIKKLESQLDNKLYYDVFKQTILKKYSKQPKRIKKLFGVEPKTVKGERGTTWYEFDIPESFKKGKAEIKAFSATGAIGTGALLSQDKPTYRFGGMIEGDPEKPPKKEPWNVPDFTDVTWTKTDLDYANKNYLCEDGACLDRSFQAYDKVVASFISGMPSSSQLKKDYNFTSAPTPNYGNNWTGYETDYHKGGNINYVSGLDEHGVRKQTKVSDKTQKWFESQEEFRLDKSDFTVDSWDASAKLIEEGGVNVFSEKRNEDYLYYDDAGARKGEDLWRSKTKAEKLKIYKSLPIGTYVGFNNYPDIYSGFNKEKGLASSGHSAQVVGYNEEGMPIIYDHEAYTTIDNPHLYTESDISNITIPKHSIGKTRDYFANQNLLKNEQKDLNLDLTELYAEGDEGELKPFYEALVKNKKELMPLLKINSDTYDEYAKNLLAIAMQETGGGTSLEHNLFGSSFGDTHGLTQLNMNNVWNDKELQNIPQEFGIYWGSEDLSDARTSAIASMIYHSRHQKVANQAYEKGRKNNKPLPGVRTYKEQKNKPLKDAARWFQGKQHTYKDNFFKTEEGPIVDLWWGDNYSPLGDWDGWQASLENIQAQLDEAKKGKYKAYKKDEKILINKNTQGNIELTPSERALYSWSGYEALRTGDAGGDSRYFKNVKKFRDLIKDK